MMQYSPSAFPLTYDGSEVKEKSVLITGGASGLGAAFARKCAAAGAFVTIADLNRDAGMVLEAELLSKNQGAKFVPTDVTSWKSQIEAFKTAIASSPSKSLDTVVAAAGIGGQIFDYTTRSSDNEDDPQEPSISCINVNLFGVYYTTQLAFYYMGKNSKNTDLSGSLMMPGEAKDRSGSPPHGIHKSIILVGSLAGYHSVPDRVEYTISKYGVRGILKSLRTDIEEAGLRLNIIAPTFISTPILPRDLEESLRDRGIQFAEVETAVNAMMVLATHRGIHGRAICVGANGNFDLRDDVEGLNAGLMLEAYGKEMDARRLAKGVEGKGLDKSFHL